MDLSAPQEQNELPSTLEAFVEQAITNTVGLTPEQADAIRVRVAPWYEYHRTRPPYLSDALNFPGADPKEVQRLKDFLGEVLAGLVTGFHSIEGVYYGVNEVMRGYIKEYLRVARAETIQNQIGNSRHHGTPLNAAPLAPPDEDITDGLAPSIQPSDKGSQAISTSKRRGNQRSTQKDETPRDDSNQIGLFN